MVIDSYTRKFKACVEVCEAVGSGIRVIAPSRKLTCKMAGDD